MELHICGLIALSNLLAVHISGFNMEEASEAAVVFCMEARNGSESG